MEEPKKKNVKLITVAASLFVLFILYLLGVAFSLYFTEGNNSLVKNTARYIPYPAIMIESNPISVREVEEKLEAVKLFYSNQDFSELGVRVDFSTPEGEKRLKVKEKYLLNKIVENKLIEKECEKRGIALTDEVVSQELDRKLNEYGSGAELKENLEKLYGWNMEDFQENIVRPDMYKEKLLEELKKNEPSFLEAKRKIEAAEKEIKSKKNFSEVVKSYSEGESSKEDGDLGWFSFDEMLPEISSAVFSLKEGEVSPIIESSLGYHLVRLEEKKQEDGVEMVKLKQVFVRTKTLADWVEEKTKETGVRVFVNDFYWDKANGQVDFKDEEMKSFEKETAENFPDDVSIIF